MNDENFDLVEKYVSKSYIQQGKEARRILEKNVRILLEQGKIPIEGWDDLSIKHLLHEIALMDSNNFPENCGVGEREARIASRLVAERHFHLGHGIGRSGDIAEIQPKAAGSSLIAKLTNGFAMDILKQCGVSSVKGCLVVPVATGMALVLTLLTLRETRPIAKYVIWPRIDQKSCFKSILTAGFIPVVIENILCEDYLTTDMESIKSAIIELGAENVLCIMSTTSCFAPRVPDRLEEIASLCKDCNVPHVVNNAYGVQATKCMHLIQQAARIGRVDAFVQSTDKNFMVPVGGSIIAAFDKTFIQAVGKMYPGRASGSPILDLFITMLSLGANGYKKLLADRKELYQCLRDGLTDIAEKHGERLLNAKQNQISLAISLTSLDKISGENKKNITEFGSYLFKRSVSGTRVVTPYDEKTIGDYRFIGWGAHSNNFPCSYLTAAAAVGATKNDVQLFLKRLDKAFKHFHGGNSAITELKDRTQDVPRACLSDSNVCNLPDVKDNNEYRQQERKKMYEQRQECTGYDNKHSTLRQQLSLDSLPSSISHSRSLSEEEISGTWPKSALRREYSERGTRTTGFRKTLFDPLGKFSDLPEQDVTQKVLLPKDKTPDRMSFLVDI